MTDEPAQGMRLSEVGFEIPGRVLLHPLTLKFKARGVTALIGQNGSGKSTLLRILARQQRATRGEVHYSGHELRAWVTREFARNVAYLPQHTPLAAGLTVRELVTLGRYPWHGALGRFSAADQAKVDEALALTGVGAYAERFLDALSGGERQRAWIAMLVAQDARLLLLDEPISALDVAHQVEVLQLLRRLSEERSVASIVVIHEINLAARFCDEIVALKNGRLIAHAEPQDIMTAERLTEIYDIAMAVTPRSETGIVLAYARSDG